MLPKIHSRNARFYSLQFKINIVSPKSCLRDTIINNFLVKVKYLFASAPLLYFFRS